MKPDKTAGFPKVERTRPLNWIKSASRWIPASSNVPTAPTTMTAMTAESTSDSVTAPRCSRRSDSPTTNATPKLSHASIPSCRSGAPSADRQTESLARVAARTRTPSPTPTASQGPSGTTTAECRLSHHDSSSRPAPATATLTAR